jgi:hypothetical protein
MHMHIHPHPHTHLHINVHIYIHIISYYIASYHINGSCGFSYVQRRSSQPLRSPFQKQLGTARPDGSCEVRLGVWVRMLGLFETMGISAATKKWEIHPKSWVRKKVQVFRMSYEFYGDLSLNDLNEWIILRMKVGLNAMMNNHRKWGDAADSPMVRRLPLMLFRCPKKPVWGRLLMASRGPSGRSSNRSSSGCKEKGWSSISCVSLDLYKCTLSSEIRKLAFSDFYIHKTNGGWL